MKARLCRLIRRLWYSELFVLQAWAALMAILSGIFVACPFATTTPPFYHLGRIVPEWVWGGGLLLNGLAQMSVAFNPRRPQLRAVTSFLGFYMWFYLALVTLMEEPRALATIVYGMVGAAWLWVLLRIPLIKRSRVV